MSVSPKLLALMSINPTRSGGVTSWSISMDFKYPFPWETTAAFVLRMKARGPPDSMVAVEIDRNIFKYNVRMPWYARLVLAKNVIWHDVLEADQTSKVLTEDGININLQRLGTVRDLSSWRACQDDPNVTLYSKRLDFNIRMPLGPTIMMQVTKPLIRWFQTKSKLCRELEVQAIRESVAAEKRDTAEERRKRLAEDAAWMAAVTTAIPPLSPPPHVDEEEQQLEESCPKKTRMAAATEKAKKAAAKAKAAGANAAERSRSSRSQADGSSVNGV